MCLVAALPLVSAALSIGGAVAGYAGAVKQANQQNQLYMDNAAEANRAAGDQYNALTHKRTQERAASSQQLFQNDLEGLRARSTARTSAGEAGVTGLSVDALLGDLGAQQGRKSEAIDSQYQMTTDSITAQTQEVKANTQSRINSVQRAAKPSFLPFLIGGASGAVGAFKGV
ncbi:virion core protein, T7 gp14 family [Roseixanthobacter pseudopolyaromaticivorans]|uniref:virion core protein, T7 gp14 family n=1 Tax=Xanthobacteraceae TaxID=335928 RepID=UPI003728F1EB